MGALARGGADAPQLEVKAAEVCPAFVTEGMCQRQHEQREMHE